MQFRILIILIAGVPIAGLAQENTLAKFEVREMNFTGGKYQNETFRYLVFAPKTIEPGKKYPLVLFLHGAGERGNDPAKVLRHFPELMAKESHREKFECFLIVPQCRDLEQWVDAPWTDKESKPMAEEPTAMLKMATGILDRELANLPVDKSRVYLTGLSMGGFGAWELAIRRPELFAAVAPICGGADETLAAKLKDIPIWTAHGDADTVVPVERTRRMVEAVKKAGGNIKYVEYPKVGHNSWTPAYRDPEGLLPWMFEQRRQPRKAE